MGNQFKKGDRVKAISVSGADERAGLKVGMIGTVVSHDTRKVIVTFDGFTPSADANHARRDGYHMLASQLELIAANHTFKPGDRVRITRKAKSYENGWGFPWVKPMDALVGQTGIVKSDDGVCGIIVKADGCTYEGNRWFPWFVLELVDEPAKLPKIPCVCIDAADEPRKFKVGDRVRVVRKIESYANGWNNSWISSLPYFPPEALELLPAKSKADELVEALREATRRYAEAVKRLNQAREVIAAASRECHDAWADVELAKENLTAYASETA